MIRRYFYTKLFHVGNGGVLTIAAAMFALGLATGATLGAHGATERKAFTVMTPDHEPAPEPPIAHRLDSPIIYPAEVLRVIDGDTFEAQVRVWPGLDVDTKIRLRDVDAAELHARCAGELA
jgi:endonuclease YncB( thermonuclease family)